MKRITALLVILALLFALSACGGGGVIRLTGPDGRGGSYPTADNPITLKLGHVGGPTSSLHEAALSIADEVREKSGGAVIIEVYPQAQLGDATIMLDGLASGTIEACMVGCNEIATMMPDFYVFVLPFLFESMSEYQTVVNNPEVKAKCNDITFDKGIKLVGFSSGEERGFSNTRRAVRSPADMAGLNIRIMSGSIYVDLFTELGVGTATMPFGEVYTALQQGVIQGEDNGVGMLVDMRFSEVEKFHTALIHMLQSNPLLISLEVWDKLSPEQQQIIIDAEAGWVENYYDFYEAYIEGKTRRALEDGVEIVYLTSEERAVFIEASRNVHDKYAAMVDLDLLILVTRLVDEYRYG